MGFCASGHLSQATSFWTVGRTSMFGNSYMIPPQGGDRRGPIVMRGGKGQFPGLFRLRSLRWALPIPNGFIKHTLRLA